MIWFSNMKYSVLRSLIRLNTSKNICIVLTPLIISYWFSLKLRVSNSKKEATTYVYACRKYHNDMIPVHLPGTCTDMRKGKLFCNTKMDKMYPLLLRRNFLCPSAFLMRIETIIIVHPSFSFERLWRKIHFKCSFEK